MDTLSQLADILPAQSFQPSPRRRVSATIEAADKAALDALFNLEPLEVVRALEAKAAALRAEEGR